MKKGKLYLIPSTLGNSNPFLVLPEQIKNTISKIDYYIVEKEKTARHFIKSVYPDKNQAILEFRLIDKHTPLAETLEYLEVCNNGIDVGVISEAGMPAIADPGATIVKLAHEKNIQVVPLVGPSSILLAMMASGLNGQCFAFHGYLPIEVKERHKKIQFFEKLSKDLNQAQIFIETPYRNMKLFESLVSQLAPETYLCVAAELTLSTEYIKSMKIKDWKKQKPDIHKRPAIFIFQK